jgi:hypothetical protein
VAAVVVFFFNTNLLPSPSALQAFYATMNKKEGIAIVAFFSLLQKKKRKKVTIVTFFAMLQGKALLLSPSSLPCSVALQKK